MKYMSNPGVHIKHYRPKILPEYINSIAFYTFDQDSDVLLHPKGVFEVIFQSNNNFQHNTSYSSNWENRPTNFVGGLHNKSYVVKAQSGNSYCIAVEFKPHTAKYFIPGKLNSYQNNLVDIRDIWGNSVGVLSERLMLESSNSKRVELIEAFFIEILVPQNRSNIDQTLAQIHASNGFITSTELAEHAYLSDAQYRSRFNSEVGISPSQYCKIVRVNSVFDSLHNKKYDSLTDLSYLMGYYDQSHFIKDFKSITGISPKQYLKQGN